MLYSPKALLFYHRANKKIDLKYLTCCDLRSRVFVQHDEVQRWKQWSLFTAAWAAVSTWRRLIKMKWMKLNQITSEHFLLNVWRDLDRKIYISVISFMRRERTWHMREKIINVCLNNPVDKHWGQRGKQTIKVNYQQWSRVTKHCVDTANTSVCCVESAAQCHGWGLTGCIRLKGS